MNNKIKLQQGDLCLFNFNPSAGHEYQGKRPAIVIESDKQISRSSLVTIMPLTSNLDNSFVDDIVVKCDDKNRLICDSVIKVHNIVSFDYKRFINRIGVVDADVLEEIKNYLKKHFDI